MNTAQSRSYIKNSLDEYLLYKGISLKKPFRCLNPLHDDRHPSMSYDPKRKKVHCFACGADYDTFDLIAIDYGIKDNAGIFKKAYEHFGIAQEMKKRETVAEYIVRSHRRVNKTDYFHNRGLSDLIIKRFKLGYDDAYDKGTGGSLWRAVIIPTGGDSFTARNTDPLAGKNDRIRKQGASLIFNADNAMERLMNENEPLFIVEGELDAMSVIEAGGNAVALGSVVNRRRLVELLTERFSFKGAFSKVTSNTEAFTKASKIAKTVIVSLDNDDEGKKASWKLLEELEGIFERCVAVDISIGRKDPNEALVNDREAFIQGIREVVGKYSACGCSSSVVDVVVDDILDDVVDDACGDYIKSSAAFYLEAFKKERGVSYPSILTGFPRLDAVLGSPQSGSLSAGLYILGAISSLGKTTFIVQMADNLAAQGADVIIFSLEMSKYELIAKSVSRHTLLEGIKGGVRDSAKSAAEIMRGAAAEENAVINAAMDAYAAYAQRIYINESAREVDDVRRAVEIHIAATGKTPVVFVDYIQILGNGNARGTDKQHMDRNITELKRISRDFKTPVIGVSSFNRHSYREAVTMEAFKESGAIEYSSDVLIGLQLAGAGKKDFDTDREKMKNPRAVELRILKNRNGRAGDTVGFSYYPEYSYFKEM